MIRLKSAQTSHKPLRRALREINTPYNVLVRLGVPRTPDPPDYPYEVNPMRGLKNSVDKLKTRLVMLNNGLSDYAPFWFHVSHRPFDDVADDFQPGTYLLKPRWGSKARGIIKLDNIQTSDELLQHYYYTIPPQKYIVEQYINYVREYRVHVNRWTDDVIAFRKMIKNDVSEEHRWFRNSTNCVFFNEQNPKFDRPACWDEILRVCRSLLNAMDLDMTGIDVRVNKSGDRFIIIETNSAPSLLKSGVEFYTNVIPKIITAKYNIRF